MLSEESGPQTKVDVVGPESSSSPRRTPIVEASTSKLKLHTMWWPLLLGIAGGFLLTPPPPVPRRPRAHSDEATIGDVQAYCCNEKRKVAAVYAVFSKTKEAQFVGVARDVRSALAKHVASQPTELCASAKLITFVKPDRAAMTSVQSRWIDELQPVGDETWAKPPLNQDEAERKLLLRQAIADDTLRDDDPDAWSRVIQKAMKDGDFDGSDLDLLEKQIEKDAAATLRRAAGDWQLEIEKQHGNQQRPPWQTARLEMYVAPGCRHCDRMRAMLRNLGAFWEEHNIEDIQTHDDDILRRARHASFHTVPQLYVLRSPPLNGRPAEYLAGGADDLAEELKIPESTAFSFKGRISDPDFL